MKSYYKVHSGPVFDIVKKHVDSHRAANDALAEWAKRHNLPIEGSRGCTVYLRDGFVPDKGCWKKSGGGYAPRHKTERGAALKKELQDLPQYPMWIDFLMHITELDVGRECDIMVANRTGWPGIIKNKGDDFYLLEIDDYWLPKDRSGLEEIKASEYK